MGRIKQIGSTASTLVALFLFLYSISVFASSKSYIQDQTATVSKSDKLPVNPNAQNPFEENQGETGDEFQDGVSLACLPEETVYLVSIADQFDSVRQASHPANITAHVPIYLATRSILI